MTAILLLILSVGVTGVVFVWAMCKAAHNSEVAMENALRQAREGKL